MAAAVTVVVVPDYAGGQEKPWTDSQKGLVKLSGQAYQEPVKSLYAENREFENKMHADILDILPPLKAVFAVADTAYR